MDTDREDFDQSSLFVLMPKHIFSRGKLKTYFSYFSKKKVHACMLILLQLYIIFSSF